MSLDEYDERDKYDGGQKNKEKAQAHIEVTRLKENTSGGLRARQMQKVSRGTRNVIVHADNYIRIIAVPLQSD